MKMHPIVVLCLMLVLLSTSEGHRRYDRRRKTNRMINGTCTFSLPCNVKERTMVVAIYTRSVNLKVSFFVFPFENNLIDSFILIFQWCGILCYYVACVTQRRHIGITIRRLASSGVGVTK